MPILLVRSGILSLFCILNRLRHSTHPNDVRTQSERHQMDKIIHRSINLNCNQRVTYEMFTVNEML